LSGLVVAVAASARINEKTLLDLSLLLLKKGGNDMGYYCNCGPTGHDMEEEEHPYKAIHTCNLVLCMGCHDRCKGVTGRTNWRKGNEPIT
jgi:hypothetical protein